MKTFLIALPLVAAIACSQSTPATDGPETTSPSTGETGPSSTDGSEVSIAGFLFEPDSIEVEVGTEVTWTNQDEILHTITAGEPGGAPGGFEGETPEAGSTFAHVFEESGTFPYFCARHEHMRGEVIVS